jgi:PAS domain S-box-containing protein
VQKNGIVGLDARYPSPQLADSMDWLRTPYIVSLYSSALLAVGLAAAVWTRRRAGQLSASLWILLSISVYAVGNALQITYIDSPYQPLFNQIMFLAVTVLPTAWFIFILQYSRRERWLKRWYAWLLAVEPAAALVLALTERWHSWLWFGLHLDESGPFPVVRPLFATGYWAHAAYSYLLIAWGMLLLLHAALYSAPLIRRQLILLLLGAVFPFGTHIAHTFAWGPLPGFNLTPLAFVITSVIVAWNLRRYWLFDIIPVARSAVVDGMKAGILVVDLRGRIVDANPAACQFLRLDSSQVIGAPVRQIFPLLAGLLETNRGGAKRVEAAEFTTEITNGEGDDLRYYDLAVSPLEDSYGTLNGRLVIWTDITERRQAEETLREREARLRLVVSQLPALLWTTDAQLHFTSFLGAGLVSLNLQPSQLIGKSVTRFGVKGDATAASVAAHRRALEGFPSPYQELWNGQVYQCYVEPLQSGLGEIIGTVGIGIDVTNRQQVERALADSEERYRQSVEHSPNPIFSTDSSGRITTWNKACEKIFSFGQDIVGRYYHELLVEPEQAGHVDGLIRRVFQEKAHLADIDLAYHTKTGSVRYMVARLYPVTRSSGKVETCVFANTDITERIKAERTLRRQLEEMSMLNAVASACVEAASETELIERVTEVIGSALSLDNYGLLLVDEPNHCLRFHPSYCGLPESYTSFKLDLKSGVAGQVAQSGLTARISDASYTQGHLHVYFQTRSEISAPVKINGQVVAVLNVESRQVDFFSESDERMLSTIAGQIATAIERLRAEAAERRRVEELLTITRVSSEITSMLDRQKLFHSIARNAADLSASDACGLFLLRPDNRFYLVASYGVGEAFIERLTREGVPRDGTAVGRAFHESRPIQISNVHSDPLYTTGHLAEMEGIVSILALPLLLGNEPIGGIVLWRRKVYQFSQEEIVFMQALAQQSVNALENARLFDAERSQRKLAEFMREVATTLTASLDLETVLDHLLGQIERVAPFSLGAILIVDQEQAYCARCKGEPQFSGVVQDALSRLQLPLSTHHLKVIKDTGQPLIIKDLQSSPYATARLNSPALRSWLGVPVLVNEHPAAIFSLYSTTPDYYDAEHASRLASLAAQAALALQNARLYDESHRRAARQEALNAIITAAVLSPDIPTLFNEVLDHTLRALSLEQGGLWVEGFSVLRGLPEDIGRFSARVPQPDAIQADQTLVVDNWSERSSSQFFAHMQKYGVQASLSVPVMAGGRRIGGMSLASENSRRWSKEEVALVEAVGRQLGGAVERLNLLAKTQEQARQVQQIMDTVPDGVILLDAERRIVLANPAAKAYLAVLAPDQPPDAPLGFLGSEGVEKLLLPPAERPWHEVAALGPLARIFEAAARPLESVGQPEGWVLVLRDVTQERESQERIQMQDRLATVGQLAAGIAHDFNNLMAAIVVYADLLTMDPHLSASSRDRLGIIQQQVQRATSLIKQILDFSRRSIMEQSEMDLLPFIKEMDKLLGRVLPENIRMDLNYQPGQYPVKADPTRLQQVFMNLALNARDAMPEGGSLSFSLSHFSLGPEDTLPYPDLTPGDWIRISVRDSGTGITPDTLPHIFDPFFTTKPVGQGTGLGLAQVYGIVKGHNGSIDVRSQVGRGTSFIIYLPALAAPSQLEGGLEDDVVLKGSGETVLLAEDDQAAREAIKALLVTQNFRVLSAENGTDALKLYRQAGEEIRLVITDIVMPGMGGMALYDALKMHCPEVKVLFVTGHPLDEHHRARLEKGSLHWLQKPFTIKTFMQAVQAVLAEKVL